MFKDNIIKCSLLFKIKFNNIKKLKTFYWVPYIMKMFLIF